MREKCPPLSLSLSVSLTQSHTKLIFPRLGHLLSQNSHADIASLVGGLDIHHGNACLSASAVPHPGGQWTSVTRLQVQADHSGVGS